MRPTLFGIPIVETEPPHELGPGEILLVGSYCRHARAIGQCPECRCPGGRPTPGPGETSSCATCRGLWHGLSPEQLESAMRCPWRPE